MKKYSWAVLLFLFLLSVPAGQAFGCTTFCLNQRGEILFGKNYDWNIGDGIVFVNKRGVAKSALVSDSANQAKWISRYGSVTFNQYGRENPNGGMNEAGLVIEVMWLDEAQYPAPDSRPSLDTLEWVQYQLDNFATVNEVIKNAERVRIESDVKLHYLVSDKAGHTATVEYLKGKLVIHTGAQLPVPALTNDTYERSLTHATMTAAQRISNAKSIERFAQAAQRTAEFANLPLVGPDAVAYAFGILSKVALPNYTQWSIVYDQKRGRVYFRTLHSSEIKTIDTKAVDYTCGAAVKVFDINAKDSGDVTAKLADYTRKANRDLIEQAFNGTDGLTQLPGATRDFVAAYPEAFPCSPLEQKADAAVPNVDQILDKFVKAVGGKAAVQAQTSRVTKATITVPAVGGKGTIETYAKAPNKVFTEMSLNVLGNSRSGFNGTVAWEEENGEVKEAPRFAKREADFYLLIKLREVYPKIAFTGKDKIGSHDVYVLEAPRAGVPKRWYFDAETGLLLRMDVRNPSGKVVEREDYQDYRAVDAIKYPFTVEGIDQNEAPFTIKYTEIKHIAIDDARFEKPGAKAP